MSNKVGNAGQAGEIVFGAGSSRLSAGSTAGTSRVSRKSSVGGWRTKSGVAGMLGVGMVLHAGESTGELTEAAADGWLTDEVLLDVAGGVDWLGDAAALLVCFGWVDAGAA